MSLTEFPAAQKRKKLLAWTGALVFVVLVAVGVFAKNDWLPHSDPLTGKKTGWFGKPLAKNASSSWNPFAAPLPDPTPQLAKEYIYAGSRLLAVEDVNANPAPPADLAVWRSSTGTWWVMGGPGSGQVSEAWGLPTDEPVPGDYDGDGKTDFSVFRPSSGEWYVLRSTDGAWEPVIAWGLQTDQRVPADYDGDGKTDRAVWRAGVWYIVQSSNGASVYKYFGSSDDLAVPADYDGDGRADAAVWRNSDKKFYSENSSNLVVQTVTTGIPADSYDWKGVSADYNGDGRADYAVFDKSRAKWYVQPSNGGTLAITPWGNANDVPVHNDYDGDGKCDIAVWRPADDPAGTVGNWFIQQSAFNNVLRQVHWGIAGDKPVPAFYRR